MDQITLTFPDSSKRTFPRGVTGLAVAESISKGLAREALAVEVSGEVWDLSRAIDADASLKILKWADAGGKYAYWHSSAHLMAEAVEALFPGTRFGIGPSIEAGFYYDMDLGGHALTPEDLAKIEEKMRELASRDVPYQREVRSWQEAVAYFEKKGDPYKLELLQDLQGETITFYHQGNFTDLCYGPHIPSTGRIKAIKLLSIAGAYWRGNEKNKMLQRVYGITFPTPKELEEHLFRLEEAKRRDHRKLGQEMEIFLLTPNVGSGLPLWLPKGTVIREALIDFLRAEQKKRGYDFVTTPHIANLNLYRTSGHYPYYKESQFPPIEMPEGDQYMLKPMNCPHHHQIYMAKPRSYRDLPVRFAEFGTVYRYEQSGEMNGLIRVRGFTQDDAHIYCTPEQLKQEVKATVELTQLVFNTFGMDVKIRLSYRDEKNVEKYGGEAAFWEQAQREIKEVADEMGLDYFIGIGEASFYGPKIDFMVRDALGRTWQLGTVQVDYVMPERFQLEYTAADGKKHRPVIIHRAPFGSLERFIGILIEHFAGEFPLWLAPMQAVVLPVTDAAMEYARSVVETLKAAGLRVEIDERNEKIGYKIREWETKKAPYMLVIGEKERAAGTVSVRQHKKGDLGAQPVEAFRDLLAGLVSSRTLTH
ncbi:MAG: threonine--tRNA ligase [Bacteroidetes bacterium]|jgi:threonyl-tRNA synthetase|nr:threonine--tRNA ligase [Bacteroidota bacterium]